MFTQPFYSPCLTFRAVETYHRPMLTAGKNARSGFTADVTFDVADSTGGIIGTINDTRSTFDLGGRKFTVTHSGVLGPVFELKSDDDQRLFATATQAPFLNSYTLHCDGVDWNFKAVVLLATKFGLFRGDTQVGTVEAGSFWHRLKGITAKLPDELPLEIHLFLLLLVIRKLTEPST